MKNAPAAAVVASGLHRQRQIIGPAEGGDEQRHQQRDHAADTFQKIAALKVGSSGDLRLLDLIGLFHQDRDKPKRDRHHHRDLVYRDMKELQRSEEVLHRVRQLIRRRGQRHDRRAGHKACEPQSHAQRGDHALSGDPEDPELPEDIARREQQIKEHRHDQDEQDPADAL